MKKIERKLITLAPVTFAIRKSKNILIPGFKGIPLFDVSKFLISQVKKVGLTERAAAISFNLIMAIPAGCIFIFTLVPYLPISKQFNIELLKLTSDVTPNQTTYKFVKDFLDDFFNTPRTGLLSFGFLLVIFYASNAMMGVIRTFDKSITAHRINFLHKRWRAIRLTIILILLIIATILILIGQEQLAIVLKKLFQMKRKAKIPWWNGVRWFIILGLLFYAISFIYKFAPSLKKRWSLISPGSILATTLSLITTFIFSYWVNNFGSYNKVYGSVGTVMIIMLLVYINSLILLIGFELNVSIMYLKNLEEEAKEKEMNGLEPTTNVDTFIP